MCIAVSELPRSAVASRCMNHSTKKSLIGSKARACFCNLCRFSGDTFAPTFAFHCLPALRIAHPFVANFVSLGMHCFTTFIFRAFHSISRACPRLSSSIAWKRPFLWLSVPRCTFLCSSKTSLHACVLLFHVLDTAFLEHLLLCTLRTTLSSKFFLSCSARFCG